MRKFTVKFKGGKDVNLPWQVMVAGEDVPVAWYSTKAKAQEWAGHCNRVQEEYARLQGDK